MKWHTVCYILPGFNTTTRIGTLKCPLKDLCSDSQCGDSLAESFPRFLPVLVLRKEWNSQAERPNVLRPVYVCYILITIQNWPFKWFSQPKFFRSRLQKSDLKGIMAFQYWSRIFAFLKIFLSVDSIYYERGAAILPHWTINCSIRGISSQYRRMSLLRNKTRCCHSIILTDSEDHCSSLLTTTTTTILYQF